MTISRTFSLLLALLFAWPCLATGGEAEDVLARIRQEASKVKSIQSTFTQTKKLSVFASEMHSTGRMLLEKPDRLRWEYLEPSESGFMVDGERAMRWSELSDEPERFAIDDDMAAKIVAEQLLAWASVDLNRLRRTFEIAVEQTSPPVLKLTPRSERLGEYLQQITISFAPELNTVRTVRITERDGDSTLLEFSEVRVNEPLPEGAFAF